MTDEKSTTSKTATESSTATDGKVDELTRIVHTHVNPTTSSSPTVSSPTGSTRTYTSPLMGTSARAAKRRIDSDSGPIRIEGTDTYNQQLQHHYQNVRQILDDQQQQQQQQSLSSDTDIPTESRQSFNAKRDFFEQRFKTPPPTYDAPPRQKIITTVTSTVSSTNVQDRTSSSSNESPSVDRVLEQAVELQKLSSNLNSTKQDTKVPFIIERTEQYQVFLDSTNHEVRRTPSISRTSIIPVGKTGHATDLDQAQAQVQAERLTDDHQAIQSLTRALQEHNISTINEYKRLPSQTNQTSSVSPSNVLHDRTNLPIKSTYSVIDALLNNPIGSVDDRYNELVKLRSNEILTNLRNPEYVNSLKQPTKTIEKKSKTKSSVSTKPVEQSSITPLVTTQTTTVPVQTAEPITTTSNLNTSTSEQAPLIDPKEKKKQDKENKKQLKKNKSKQKSKTDDYSVLDAIIGSPVSIRLPDSYLTKYHVSPPLSQSAPLSSEPISTPSNTDVTKTTATTSSSPKTKTKTKKKSSSKEKSIPDSEKNKTLFHLTKIVNDVKSHHSTDLPLSSTAPAIEPKESIISTKPAESTVKQVTTTTTTTTTTTSKHTDTQQKSEPVTPRIIYRYMDEYGNVLKISSTPPSQLREQPSQIYANRSTEPPYFYGRHIAIDDERRHPLAQYEQRATWQGESKLPTTVTREDFESQDKRVPQLIEQSIPASRTVPVSVDHERSSRPSSSQPHQPQSHQYPNQQNIKLAWLPLSYPSDPYYLPAGVAGYETDSTISERSATYRPLEHGLNDGYYRYSARPIPNDYYNRSPVPGFYPPPPPLLSHGGRGISPDYSSNSVSRNYIEVFRGGDFRQTKPSEIYSLPFNEHMRTSPLISTNNRPSRYDQYQSEQYGTLSNSAPFRPSTLSTQQTHHSTNTLPHTHYQTNIPSSTVHTSTYYTHRNPNSNRTVQNSPDPDYSNYVRQSKSFDYRPLRSKLQREYKITPNLLVDEWDYPHTSETTKCSTTTTVTTTNRSGLSSPDEVFFPTRSVKA